MEQKEIAIEIKNLTKEYKMYPTKKDRLIEAIFPGVERHTTFRAMDNLNLEVKKGEILGILGKNGAGKSTLLKMVTGVVTPTSGEIKTNGKISSLLELGTAFNMELTGIENIYQHGQVMGLTNEQIEERKQEIIDFADIGEHLYQPVKTYSSGMFARLAFSCAINVDPEILIVDEALSVGDLRFQMKCMDKMKQMMDQGITVLFVSHDINAIRRLCTKTVWLRDGKIQTYGETNYVCDQYLDFLKVGDEYERDIVEVETGNEVEFKKFREGKQDSVAEIIGIRILNRQGKNVEEFDIFDPVRIEIVYDVYDEKETMKAMKKMQSGRFGLDDMLDQMHQLKKLGPLSGILKMIPGMPSMPNLNDETTDKRMKETESIIYSMTLEERRDPSIITLSRKQRIAKGCGKDLAAINRLLKQFEQSKQMMKQMSNMDMATGLPKMGGGHFVGGPNRKKVRHKKKKKK